MQVFSLLQLTASFAFLLSGKNTITESFVDVDLQTNLS